MEKIHEKPLHSFETSLNPKACSKVLITCVTCLSNVQINMFEKVVIDDRQKKCKLVNQIKYNKNKILMKKFRTICGYNFECKREQIFVSDSNFAQKFFTIHVSWKYSNKKIE